MRRLVSGILVCVLLLRTMPLVAGEEDPVLLVLPQGQTLREKIVEIPLGSVVEVLLTSNDELRGQLITVTETGFTVQTAEGNTIDERQISYDQVRSIKVQNERRGTNSVWYVLGGIGAFFLVIMVVVLVAQPSQ